MRGNVHDFIKSYLYNRSQYTCANDINSDLESVIAGVPQGSILSPLLFNLFINDIVSLKVDNVTLYADDAVFCLTDDNFYGCIARVNEFIYHLTKWLNMIQLIPNTDKTVVMLFSNSTENNLPNIFFRGNELQWVDEIKYLGLYLDRKLLFSTHINKVCSKISSGQGVIYSLSSYLPIKVLLSLYYTLVYPHVNMNIII